MACNAGQDGTAGREPWGCALLGLMTGARSACAHHLRLCAFSGREHAVSSTGSPRGLLPLAGPTV